MTQEKHIFKVGEKAILNNEIAIRVSTEATLLREGAEIEIIRVPCRNTQFYEIRYGESTGLVEDKDLTPITPKIEFKFKVCDKVKHKDNNYIGYIIDCINYDGKPAYECVKEDASSRDIISEDLLELYTEPKDITERIKTFEDAKDWCVKNGFKHLVEDWCITTPYYEEKAKDISAYLKLRIITCALNEGWEPDFWNEYKNKYWALMYTLTENEYISLDKDEKKERCYRVVSCSNNNVNGGLVYASACYSSSDDSSCNGSRLAFKSRELATYAAKQFKEIYADFYFG